MRIEPVRSAADRKSFLRLPWSLYGGDPAWVPPLLHDMKTAMDPAKHPFHAHADVEYFLARKGGKVVGRIAACVNRLHIDFHDERLGFFGFFESVDDVEVARGLLGAAEAWLSERGMQRVRGPMNFSTNEEVFSPGLLIDGFEHPPIVLMAHSLPYYPALLEAAGYDKSKDLLAYWIEHEGIPERLTRTAGRLLRESGVVLRPIDVKQFRREIDTIKAIYNSAWERNWGFVPMSDAEFENMAKQLKPVIEPKLTVIAELEGQPVGFAVALPDFNQAIRHANGRLLPFGLFKILWHKRKIDRARVLTLGLRPEFRRKGIDAMMYLYLWENSTELGMPRGEASWILEENWEMRRGIERMGGRVYKTYRVYDRELAAS